MYIIIHSKRQTNNNSLQILQYYSIGNMSHFCMSMGHSTFYNKNLHTISKHNIVYRRQEKFHKLFWYLRNVQHRIISLNIHHIITNIQRREFLRCCCQQMVPFISQRVEFNLSDCEWKIRFPYGNCRGDWKGKLRRYSGTRKTFCN